MGELDGKPRTQSSVRSPPHGSPLYLQFKFTCELNIVPEDGATVGNNGRSEGFGIS